jgi:hypothetical protein
LIGGKSTAHSYLDNTHVGDRSRTPHSPNPFLRIFESSLTTMDSLHLNYLILLIKHKTMNKLLPIALGLLLLVSNASVPATAVTSSTKCNQILKSVRKSLSGVVSFKTNVLGNRGQPRGRTKALNISFKNGADLPEATQKAIATRVIRSCSQIASVSFSLYQSDGGNVFGIKNNQIILFTCVEAGVERKLPWGVNYCL